MARTLLVIPNIAEGHPHKNEKLRKVLKEIYNEEIHYICHFIIICNIICRAPILLDRRVATRRKKRVLKTNIAIVAGSTAAGALIGRGRNGAMIGAGAGLLYASSRKGTKRRSYRSKKRRYAKIAGGALLGTGLGAWMGGKKGAIIGAAAGGGATYLYTPPWEAFLSKKWT